MCDINASFLQIPWKYWINIATYTRKTKCVITLRLEVFLNVWIITYEQAICFYFQSIDFNMQIYYAM